MEELRYWDEAPQMPTTVEKYLSRGFCVDDEDLEAGTHTHPWPL
jgi:hypothetical protein